MATVFSNHIVITFHPRRGLTPSQASCTKFLCFVCLATFKNNQKRRISYPKFLYVKPVEE